MPACSGDRDSVGHEDATQSRPGEALVNHALLLYINGHVRRGEDALPAAEGPQVSAYGSAGADRSLIAPPLVAAVGLDNKIQPWPPSVQVMRTVRKPSGA